MSTPPWFNEDIMQAKRNRRRAERKWRASGLPYDLAVFKAKRNLTLHLLDEARRTYYTQFIDDNSSDQSKLFRASKSLLNLQADRALPPHNDALSLANEMGEFFIRKITAIRSQLGANGKSVSRDVTCEPATVELRSDGIELSQFQPLSKETVRQMAVANSKSCALDPLPSAFLSTCIDELLLVITKMVNLSSETVFFCGGVEECVSTSSTQEIGPSTC